MKKLSFQDLTSIISILIALSTLIVTIMFCSPEQNVPTSNSSSSQTYVYNYFYSPPPTEEDTGK